MGARQFGAKREARRTVRRLVDLECEVYCELWGQPIPHRATDVSEDGLWIHTELLLEAGTEVVLTFYPPDWDEPLCVAGRVERVELRSRPGQQNAIGMGVAFEALRADERRRLSRSIRCLRAQESFILDQRTLTGVPVGAHDADEPARVRGATLAGWAAPTKTARPRTSRTSAMSTDREERAWPGGAFSGGLDLAASVFSPGAAD